MKRWGLLALFAAGILLLIGGVLWKGGHFPRASLPALGTTVSLIDDGRPMPEFHLVSPQGEFSDASLRGRWTFLTFGYTHCPDVCPANLFMLNEVIRQLGEGRRPQVVFVSVDAPRDTLDVLQRYVPAFNPAFIGVTGSDAALKPLVRELGVYYVRNQAEATSGDAAGNYSVDHTSSIFLMAPDGSLRAVFQAPLEAAQMARDTAAIMAR